VGAGGPGGGAGRGVGGLRACTSDG
jgi:hypothetical protein